MGDSRKKILVRAIVNGFPVQAALESFSPPSVEKTTEDEKGGRFVGLKSVVGVELGEWSLTLTGAHAELISAMGDGDQAEVTVLESVKSDDGAELPRSHAMSGEVTKAEEGDVKVGKESLTLTGTPFAYTLKENSVVVHDINAKTQKCVVGGKDLLETARRHVDI